MVRACAGCGKTFESRAWNTKSCSSRCSLRQWRARNPERNRQIKQDWRRRNGVLEFGSPEHRKAVADEVRGKMVGEKHPFWKGEKVCYRNLHKWVERCLGKPSACEQADGTCNGRFEWSNISGSYKRVLSDWQRLCKSHHTRYDRRKEAICQ